MKDFSKNWDDFIELLMGVESLAEMKSFLRLFLASEERKHIIDRYLTMQELIKKEKPQRQISKDLNVSIAKITRCSNSLKEADVRVIQRLKVGLKKN